MPKYSNSGRAANMLSRILNKVERSEIFLTK